MYACLRRLVYIVENKQRPYVMSIVIVYKSLTELLGDQWSLNLPLFTVWSLSVQWTAFLFSTIVPHSLKHLSLKCLQRQINCHRGFKPGNWEEKGHKGTEWIILHEIGGGGIEMGREGGRDVAFPCSFCQGWTKACKHQGSQGDTCFSSILHYEAHYALGKSYLLCRVRTTLGGLERMEELGKVHQGNWKCCEKWKRISR